MHLYGTSMKGPGWATTRVYPIRSATKSALTSSISRWPIRGATELIRSPKSSSVAAGSSGRPPPKEVPGGNRRIRLAPHESQACSLVSVAQPLLCGIVHAARTRSRVYASGLHLENLCATHR